MRFIKGIHEFLNETAGRYSDLEELAREHDYETFVDKTDALASKYNIIYRGMSEDDELEDDSFFGEWVGHAREYGDHVDGVLVPMNDIMEFDNDRFEQFRLRGFDELLSLPSDVDYDEDAAKIKSKLRKIYQPYFDNYKLDDAMYQLDYDEDKVIDFAYDFVVDSTEDYEKISKNKQNDFLVPLLMHYVKSKGKNVLSFWGGDYAMAGGALEFVVADVSKYDKLSDIWKNANDAK